MDRVCKKYASKASKSAKGNYVTRKAAFTLAEVLITLGIIGVVAAMTLPTLTAKHQEKARIANLKKIYSQLQNAFNLAVYENGPMINWGLTNSKTGILDEDGAEIIDKSSAAKFMSYITKYLKKGDDSFYNSSREVVSLDGRLISEAMSGNWSTINSEGNIFITSDGFILTMGWIHNNGATGDFWVTLPNEKQWQTGVTRFHFTIDHKKGFVANGQTQTSFRSQCDVKSKSIASDINGRSCTAWALQNENMEYLRCNDLSWNGKRKCK